MPLCAKTRQDKADEPIAVLTPTAWRSLLHPRRYWAHPNTADGRAFRAPPRARSSLPDLPWRPVSLPRSLQLSRTAVLGWPRRSATPRASRVPRRAAWIRASVDGLLAARWRVRAGVDSRCSLAWSQAVWLGTAFRLEFLVSPQTL
jgi:hypothetical protein